MADHRFDSLCDECEEPLVFVDKFKVCPRGHGRLMLTTPDERRSPEYFDRQIVQSSFLRRASKLRELRRELADARAQIQELRELVARLRSG